MRLNMARSSAGSDSTACALSLLGLRLLLLLCGLPRRCIRNRRRCGCAVAPIHFIRLGEGFIRQVSKIVGGTKSVVAGFECQRE